MSTRGCVAIGKGDGWQGVYNHSDSYPTGLGEEVFKHLQARLLKDGSLHQFAEDLLSYGDWREYENDGVCGYCGKVRGQPHDISGVIFLTNNFQSEVEIRSHYADKPWDTETRERAIASDIYVMNSMKETGFPDPEAKFHKHGNGPDDHLTNKIADPLFIEWVYVIDPDENTMAVLASHSTEKKGGNEKRRLKDGGMDYGDRIYRHKIVAVLKIQDENPDWEEIERRAE